VLFFHVVGAYATDSTQPKITLSQARALILATLSPEQKHLPYLEILASNKNSENISSYKDSVNPKFLSFTVVWAQPIDGGSVIVGYYDIDPYTGDVFHGVAATCAGLKNQELETLQRKIRQSLHLTLAAYRKIKTKGPMCMD
jgi:hypothetical protein